MLNKRIFLYGLKTELPKYGFIENEDHLAHTKIVDHTAREISIVKKKDGSLVRKYLVAKEKEVKDHFSLPYLTL